MSDVRIIYCPECLGDGGFEMLGNDYDRNTGAPQTYWKKCDLCLGAGEIEISVDPIQMEDLEEIDT